MMIADADDVVMFAMASQGPVSLSVVCTTRMRVLSQEDTDRQTDRQSDKQTERQTKKHADIETNKHARQRQTNCYGIN